MALNLPAVVRKTWQTAASIKTGVVLLILVVILAAAGTVILQRPMTDPEDMQRAYSPQALRLLDGASDSSLHTGLQTLGLRLEPRKAPIQLPARPLEGCPTTAWIRGRRLRPISSAM